MEMGSNGTFGFSSLDAEGKLKNVPEKKEGLEGVELQDPLMDYVRGWGPDILKGIAKFTNLPISEIKFNLVESNEFAKKVSKGPDPSILTQFLDMCDAVGNFEYTIVSRREIDDVLCATENFRPHVTRIHIGSNADGFRFKGSKLDVMIVPDFMKVFPDIKSLRDQYRLQNPDLSKSNGRSPKQLTYVMHIDDTTSGYSKLFRVTPVAIEKGEKIYTESWDIHEYFSARSFLNICKRHFLGDQPVYGAQCASKYAIQTYNNIFCLHCPFWPPQAEEWPYKQRKHKWPPKKTIQKVIECGCYLVPVESTPNASDLDWRITFSTAEKILIRSMDEFQFKAYSLLRIIVRKVVRKNPKFHKVIFPYIVLTAMLRALEVLPITTWCEENFKFGCYDCIDYLVNGLEDKIIPHYFIPDVNLYNFDAPSSVVHDAVKALASIRTKTLQFKMERSPDFELGCQEMDSDAPEEMIGQGFIPVTGLMVELMWDLAMYKELRLPVQTNIDDVVKQLERAIHLQDTEELMPEVKRGFLKYLIIHLKRNKSNLMLRRLFDEVGRPPTDDVINRRVECLHLILDCVSIDVTSGRLAIATSYYRIRHYKETIHFAAQAMEMYDWLVMYFDHDGERNRINPDKAKDYERIVCGKNLRFGDKIRGTFAFNVTFPKKKAVLPNELKFDLLFCEHPLHLSISPVVYGHFILFLSHFYKDDKTAARKNLKKLEATLNDAQHNAKPYVNLNLIGECYRILKLHEQALGKFREAYHIRPNNRASLWHALLTIFEKYMFNEILWKYQVHS